MEDSLVVKRLQARKWFNASEKSLQQIILGCKNDSFLAAIGQINDEYEFSTVLRALGYWSQQKLSGINIELRNNHNNQVTISEIIFQNQGDSPLARGMILLEENGKVDRLILESKFNTVTLNNYPRTFTMAFPDFSNGQIVKLPSRVTEAIPNNTIIKYIDLGEVYPDDNLLSTKTILFAVLVEVVDVDRIDLSKVTIIDLKDDDVLKGIKDGYALAVIARLKSQKII